MGVLSKLGRLYKKYWIVPTTVLGLEAAVASYSLHKAVRQERPFVDIFLGYNKYYFDNIESFMSVPLALYCEKSHLRSFRENKNSLSFEELVATVNHPQTLKALEDLIVKDRADVFTEIPFQIWLERDKDKKPFLIFYDRSDTLNSRNAKLLVKYRDNPSFVLDFVKSNEKYYKMVTKIPDELFNKNIKLLEDISKLERDEVDNKELESLRKRMVGRDSKIIKRNIASIMAYLYLWNTDDVSIDDTKALKDFYWNNFLKFRGVYIGEGHIHQIGLDGPEPSPNDLEASKHLRQIIFAETPSGMRVYDVSKGQIRSADFEIK
ncbi:MAG: hypothetical protein ABIH63_04535 [archaeon]